MERRLYSVIYIIQISLLLLVAGCGGEKEASPTLPPHQEAEEKMGISIGEAHFIQSDAQGRKLLEVWAKSSEGREEELTLKGVKCILYEKEKPLAELSAPSAIYQPGKGRLLLDKGANLRNLLKSNDIICDSLELLFREKKIRGEGISLKWGDVILEGKELLADWDLKKGILRDNAVVKINQKRRVEK